MVTGILESKSNSSRRLNWSLIKAFSGEMYTTPTEADGWLYSSVSTGRKAASVLPEAVPEDSSRLSSLSKTTSQAATCIPRSSSHLF